MDDILTTIKLAMISTVFVELGEPDMIFAWYQRLLNKLPLWLAMPLGACYKCLTGQVCFWYFLIKGTPVINLGFYVSLGIVISLLINKLWEILEN